MSFNTAASRPSSSSAVSAVSRRDRSSAPMRLADSTMASTGASARPASHQPPAAAPSRASGSRPASTSRNRRRRGVDHLERHRRLHELHGTAGLHDGHREHADRGGRPREPNGPERGDAALRVVQGLRVEGQWRAAARSEPWVGTAARIQELEEALGGGRSRAAT